MLQIIDIVERERAAGHTETATLLNLTPADVSLGMWSQAKASVDAAALRAEPGGLPAIHDVRQALAPNGVT